MLRSGANQRTGIALNVYKRRGIVGTLTTTAITVALNVPVSSITSNLSSIADVDPRHVTISAIAGPRASFALVSSSFGTGPSSVGTKLSNLSH